MNNVATSNHKQSKPIYLAIALFCPLRRVFDYILPVELALKQNIAIGTRVKVPFGHNRQLIGIVLAIKSCTDISNDKLKEIDTIIDQKSIMPTNVLQLCNWASQYYHHPIGDVLASALPKLLREGKLLSELETIYYQLSLTGQQLDTSSLTKKPAQAKALALLQQQANKQLTEQDKIKFTRATISALGISPGIFTQLIKAEYLVKIKKIPSPNKTKNNQLTADSTKQAKLILNTEQQTAVDQVGFNQFQCYLLDGITGSGKTEVYFHLIEQAIQQNKQCLVLIPEISLTPQTITRFQARFNQPIAALHSALSDKERLSAWLFAKTHQVQIIIGTRSAVFTPFDQLGLIIIDEEHDTSFKQQEGFRYHARDVAIMRAKQANIPIVLGSATPALESYYNASHTQRYQWLQLRQRAGQAQLPSLQLIDLNHDSAINGLAAEALKQIQTHLAQQQQVLLFINRRGYAPVLYCQSCGWKAQCNRCDSNMVCHKNKNKLICHHCGNQSELPTRCPSCHSISLTTLGQGTQRIAEYIEQQLPDYPILRIDRDAVNTKQQLETQLNLIHQQNACVLIGTQMLAKGHHFPNVTLVVILDIDHGLMSTDFRAQEQTAQLIMQVAGRAGRAEKSGKVLLQTYQPKHRLLQSLLKQDYSQTLQHLLPERIECGLPPSGFLALFRAEAKTAKQAFDGINQIKTRLIQAKQQQTKNTNTIAIYDAVPAPMQRKAGYYRVQLLLQASSRSQLQLFLSKQIIILSEQKNLSAIRWSIDIDPIDLY